MGVAGAVLVMVAALIFYLIGPDTAGLVYLGAVILGLGKSIEFHCFFSSTWNGEN